MTLEEDKKQPTTPPPANDDALHVCERDRDEYLNGWRRAKADLINYKKEELARAEQLIQFGNEELLKDLIHILDSFDLAEKNGEGNNNKGFAQIKSQLETLIKKKGMEPYPSKGMRYNPMEHEALSEIESQEPEGTVIEEVARGWKLHGKVIRPAKVNISKGPKM